MIAYETDRRSRMMNTQQAGNVTLKISWLTGILYALVTAAVSVGVICVGLFYAMPGKFAILRNGELLDVFITEDFYNRCTQIMLVSAVFPAGAYLGMYSGYVRLAAKMPERKHEIKQGKEGKPWAVPLVLQILLMLLWGFVGWVMISLGLQLKLENPVDAAMFQRYVLVYGIAMGVDVLLFAIGTLFFKPGIIQRA